MRVLLIVIALCATAHADEPDGPRDPAVATWLSVGATAASYAAVGVTYGTGVTDTKPGRVVFAAGLAGIWLAPSLGQVYADSDRASGGLVLRIVALPTAALGVAAIAVECGITFDDCAASEHRIGTGVIVGATAMLVGGTVWELLTVGDSARRFNRRWRDPPSVSVVPTTSGFAVAGRF